MRTFCKPFFLSCLTALFMCINYGYAQEIEDSATLFLEEYSDDFEEAFFEGIKQKSIGNYDRAINSFLVCQKMEPNNAAIANELAKAYIKINKYSLGQEQAELALKENPDNMWYLQTLYTALQKQYKNSSNLKEIVSYSNPKIKENLAHILYLERNFNEAKSVLSELKDSRFKTDLNTKIQAAIDKKKPDKSNSIFVTAPTKNNTQTTITNNNSVYNYKSRLELIVKQKNYNSLEITAKEAIETYPTQPYFYYTLGLAYNGKKKHKAAIETLQTALDYVIDDVKLGNAIYREIAIAYTKTDNPEKTKLYLEKIK